MQNYSFDIINARFIAAGLAVQAKGMAYYCCAATRGAVR